MPRYTVTVNFDTEVRPDAAFIAALRIAVAGVTGVEGVNIVECDEVMELGDDD